MVKVGALVQQPAAPAGLRRISHAAVGGQGYVFDNSGGAGITVYVVDTGIRTTHVVGNQESWWCKDADLSRSMEAAPLSERTS